MFQPPATVYCVNFLAGFSVKLHIFIMCFDQTMLVLQILTWLKESDIVFNYILLLIISVYVCVI